MAWEVLRIMALAFLLGGIAVALWLAQRVKDAPAMDWRGHLEDLRKRLLISTASVLLGTVFFFGFRWDAGKWYPVPAVEDNLASQAFLVIQDHVVPDNVQTVVLRPIDGFMAEFTVAVLLAVLSAMPVIIQQLGGFLWPALRPQEQRYLRLAFVPALGLFMAGAAFAYFVVLPFLMETLYSYGTALGAEPFLQVSELITFVVGMVLVFGIAFQTPLVMFTLTRVGLVAAGTWLSIWRYAVVAIFILAAFVTDPTVASQIMVAVPLLALYFLGVGLAHLARKPA